MHVIGTAGHVDHGKSTLVEALTGINPDRLKEERERQMTIDLGFAWLTLPNGESVGVIDVPGHRDFIENMLAGVGGIDAALFVVAADEGVMPQTREHLAILDLLQIPGGVVALTKTDLVDREWQTLVTTDLISTLQGTVLEGAPILPVSARRGEGLPQLKEALQRVLADRPARPNLGRPRLPIDRIFSLAGFGTVVTGTLTGGSFSLGDEVEILPAGLGARVRGLQTHKTKIERAVPGSRVAVNLVGVDMSQLQRGMVVAHPGTFRATAFVDARFQHLADSDLPLKHNAEVKFFLGASEVLAKVRLLESDLLLPGESGWVQLALSEPVVALKGDRFILRRPSPGATIGGGLIIDPHPSRERRYRRRDPATVARLETLARGAPGELLLQALDTLGLAPLKDALQKAGLDNQSAQAALAELSTELIHLDGDALVMSSPGWRRLETNLRTALTTYHAAHPLRIGMPREELKSRLGLTPREFNAVLNHAVHTGLMLTNGANVRLASHQVTFSASQQKEINILLADFRRDPYNTPSFKDCVARIGEDVLTALIEQDTLIQVSPDVLFLNETYAQMVERIRDYLLTHGKITVAEVRDLFSTSRKYALALMEYLDAHGITKRVGDERVLKA
jgi:selenocysteine-specific elongation factor